MLPNPQSSFQLSLIKPKQSNELVLWPITADANSLMSQSEYKAITRNRCKMQKSEHMQEAVGFGFHLLEK